MNNGTEPQTPIEYPDVVIAGKPYKLKLTLGALFRLEEQGLDLQAIFEEMRKWMKTDDNPQPRIRITVISKILAAGIGDQIKFTPEQVADQLVLDDLKQIAAAITVAIGKMLPPAQTVRLQEPVAPNSMEPSAIQ